MRKFIFRARLARPVQECAKPAEFPSAPVRVLSRHGLGRLPMSFADADFLFPTWITRCSGHRGQVSVIHVLDVLWL